MCRRIPNHTRTQRTQHRHIGFLTHELGDGHIRIGQRYGYGRCFPKMRRLWSRNNFVPRGLRDPAVVSYPAFSTPLGVVSSFSQAFFGLPRRKSLAPPTCRRRNRPRPASNREVSFEVKTDVLHPKKTQIFPPPSAGKCLLKIAEND